jgi:hypothetical protein
LLDCDGGVERLGDTTLTHPRTGDIGFPHATRWPQDNLDEDEQEKLGNTVMDTP